MISKEEVKHIAKLARIGLSSKEIEKFRKELSSILDYVEKLKEVDVSGVEATSHPFEIKNVMREDLAEELEEKGEKLLESAPEKKGDYLKVKSILK